MKKIYSLIILCLLAAACQQQSVPGSPTDGQPSNIGKTVFYSADDEPLAFLPSWTPPHGRLSVASVKGSTLAPYPTTCSGA